MPMGLRLMGEEGTLTVVRLKGTGASSPGAVVTTEGIVGVPFCTGCCVWVVVIGSLRPSKTVVVVTVWLVDWVPESCCELGPAGKLGKGSLPPSRLRGLVDRRDDDILDGSDNADVTTSCYRLDLQLYNAELSVEEEGAQEVRCWSLREFGLAV